MTSGPDGDSTPPPILSMSMLATLKLSIPLIVLLKRYLVPIVQKHNSRHLNLQGVILNYVNWPYPVPWLDPPVCPWYAVGVMI